MSSILELKNKLHVANTQFTGKSRKDAVNLYKKNLQLEKQRLAFLETETTDLLKDNPDLVNDKTFVITRVLQGCKSQVIQDAFTFLFSQNLGEANELVESIIKKEKQKSIWGQVRSLVEYK